MGESARSAVKAEAAKPTEQTLQTVAVEPSPAHTPLSPPPGVHADGTVDAPPPTPAETAPLPPEPFADELPPDFWGDDPIIPEAPQNTRESYAEDAVTDRFSPPDTRQAPEAPPQTVKPLSGSLETDPRFVLITELFPGRMTDWQSAEAPAAPEADNAAEAPETVDLERGLDADEPD